MANRIPLVLTGLTVAELKRGDSLSAISKKISVINRNNVSVDVTLENGPYFPIGTRSGSIANVILEV